MLDADDAGSIDANRGSLNTRGVVGIESSRDRARDPTVVRGQRAAKSAKDGGLVITNLKDYVTQRGCRLNHVAAASAAERTDHHQPQPRRRQSRQRNRQTWRATPRAWRRSSTPAKAAVVCDPGAPPVNVRCRLLVVRGRFRMDRADHAAGRRDGLQSSPGECVRRARAKTIADLHPKQRHRAARAVGGDHCRSSRDERVVDPAPVACPHLVAARVGAGRKDQHRQQRH
ncbi:unannotated protein [freshwater metagenome]|uniref:Unannotated protein n=1 Tax=freshwater metagenome TaxID=449393 RepID=A0A6J7RKC6_9ZZZZ